MSRREKGEAFFTLY